jgi:Fur family ferric uptake transcriptional regulator
MKEMDVNLNDLDLRITRQRQVILDEFRKANTHLTADEVYNRVRKRIPRVSLGTIYRNLEILSGSGLIHKIELGGHQKLFDGNLNDHYHLRCIQCGKIIDIPASSVRIDTANVDGAERFEIKEFRLELLGVCPECNNKK